MDVKNGYYYGTEIDEKWWKRYKESNFFMRGNGEYWINQNGIYFRKFMTQQPLMIPFNKIMNIKSGWFHAGKTCIGKKATKIIWKKEGTLLCSGFNFGTTSETEISLEKIKNNINKKGKNE